MSRSSLLLVCGLLLAACSDSGGPGGAGGSGGGAGGGGNGPLSCDELLAVASAQTVTITLTNDTLTDRFLVLTTIGDECEALSINRIANGSSDGVRQDEGFQCGCECPGPGPSGPALLQRIAPGASFDVSWDAREAILCSQSYEDCGDGTGATTYGSRKAPVAPGDYEIRLMVLNGAPVDCLATADGFDCGANLQLECSGDQDIVVPFTIDAAGDVTLMASIAS